MNKDDTQCTISLKRIMNNSIYQISEKMMFESFNNGALILHLEDLSFFELNLSAGEILKVTNGKNNLVQVARHFADVYQIELETAIEDVICLYEQLSEQGLIEQIQ